MLPSGTVCTAPWSYSRFLTTCIKIQCMNKDNLFPLSPQYFLSSLSNSQIFKDVLEYMGANDGIPLREHVYNGKSRKSLNVHALLKIFL